jgi:hypothetical protein
LRGFVAVRREELAWCLAGFVRNHTEKQRCGRKFFSYTTW